MTGYREHSFDPRGIDSRPPLRPFTPVQWTGLAFLVFGALAIAVFVLGRVGVVPRVVDDEIPFVSFMPIGAALMNSRGRSASCDPAALKRRRIAIVILALVVAVAAAVLAFLISKGA
jgi:hypothetical protein